MEDQQDLINRINKLDERWNFELKEINKKLENHMVHMAGDIAAINTNLSWLCKGKNPNGESKESKDDVKTQQDVDWLKRFFWVQVGLLISLISVVLQHILFT